MTNFFKFDSKNPLEETLIQFTYFLNSGYIWMIFNFISIGLFFAPVYLRPWGAVVLSTF